MMVKKSCKVQRTMTKERIQIWLKKEMTKKGIEKRLKNN